MCIYNLQKVSCLKWNNFVWIFICIFEDYSDLENLPLVNNEWTFYPILFPWWLLHFFIIDVSIFNTNEEKEGKNQFFNYFWRMLLKFEEKKFEIQKLSQLLITWILRELKSCKPWLKIFQKSNYLTDIFWVVKPT